MFLYLTRAPWTVYKICPCLSKNRNQQFNSVLNSDNSTDNMQLLFPQVLAILATTAQAVDVASYATMDCRSQITGVCLNWPQNNCCEFARHHGRMYNDLRSTKSVGWRNLQECDIGSWHWPPNNQHTHGLPEDQCGTVKDAVHGPSPQTCMTSTISQSTTGDGAMWLVLLTCLKFKKCSPGKHRINIAHAASGQCPKAESVKASSIFSNKFGHKIFGTFPVSGAKKRDTNQTDPLAALNYAYRHDPNLKCKGKIYADTLGWTNGTGVWVLEGSKQNHELYTNVSGTYAHLDRNGWMEKAGAKYYEHCSYLFIYLLNWTYVLTDLGNQHPASYAAQTNHGQDDKSNKNDKRSFAGKKWVTGKGLVNEESVIRRSADPDTESFPWIPESNEENEDKTFSKRNTESDTESFPWIPESEEENEEADGADKRDIGEEEPYESFPWIQ